MTKRLGGKLLSVILTIAICLSTILGCLITANAADVACYSWSEGTVDKETLQTATIDLTLTAPADLSGGITEAVFNFNSDEWAISKIDVTDGACVSGEFDAANYSVSFDGNQVDFATTPVDENVDSDTLSVSNVTLALTLTFKSGTATQGEKYNITISELNMGNSYEAYNYTATAVNGVINAGCDHVYSVAGLEPIETNTVDGYYVYKDVPCSKCGDINPYQIVPATELKNILYWDGEVSTTEDLTGSGTEADPYIIDSAADLAYVTSSTLTTGEYYKVADGIDAIVLQPEIYAESIMALADYAQTKAYFESITPTVWKNGGAFKGTFDGNGVEIYGIYTNKSGQGALFAFANEGTTFKNFSIKNSYFGSGDFAGTVVGKIYATKELTEVSAENVITFDKLVISGNYLEFDHKNYSRMGILFGGEQPWTSGTQHNTKYITFTITNSLVHSNLGVATMYPGVYAGLFGARHTGWSPIGTAAPNKYDNLIILDCTPYGYTSDDPATTPAGTKATNQATQADFYSNVYTNCVTEFSPCTNNPNWSSYDGKIIVIDKAEAKGTGAKTNLSGLAWDSIWFADENGGYPTFSGDVLDIAGETDFWTADSNIAAEYRADGDNYGYTDGNMQLLDPSAENSESNPYLVETAEQLCYLIRGGKVVDSTQSPAKTDTNGKYYKVADGISTFYLNKLNGEYIDNSTKIDDIYDYMFGDGTNGDGNNFGIKNYFQGHFDGNGVTIYGLAQGVTKHGGGTYSAGLFPYVSGNASIKNVAVSKAFLCTKDQAGGIVGKYTGKTSTTVDSTTTSELTSLTIENCSVTDSYLESIGTGETHTIGAIIGYADGWISGVGNASVKINNCFVSLEEKYFNTVSETVTHDASVTTGSLHGGVLGYGGTNQVRISNTVVLGVKPYNTWKNNPSSAIGQHGAGSDRFSNVYTDQPTGTILCGIYNNGTEYKSDYSKVIFNISASSIKGETAVDTLGENLDFNTVWSYDGNGGYPTPVPQSAIYTNSQLNLNLLGVNNNYNNDGTFNFNFYYEPASASIAPVLYVGRADGNGFNKLTGVALEAAEASALGVAEGTLRYTIENISAREIGDTFLGTAVAKNGASTVWGKTEAISVADYAGALLKDNSVSAADKKVAAALINYGTASTEAFNVDAPVIAKKKVVYASISNMEPDDSFMDGNHGTGEEDNPYIISTPGQLRYLVQNSTYATTHGKFFEIDETIATICLQGENYIGSLESFTAKSATEIKEYFDKNTTNRWQWQAGVSNVNDCFSGTFNGNGVKIIGVYTTSGGLFGTVNEGTVVKNLTVSNSYITAGWYASAVVGGAYCSKTYNDVYVANGYDGNVNPYGVVAFENVIANNNFIFNKGNARDNTGVLLGGVIGTGYDTNGDGKNDKAHASIAVKMDSCLVHGNKALAETALNSGEYVDHPYLFGILSTGHSGDSAGFPNGSYTNSVILDCAPFAYKASAQAFKPAYYSNVYTNCEVPSYGPGGWKSAFEGNFPEIIIVDGAESFIGANAVTTCNELDWDKKWIVNKNAYPTPAQQEIEVTGAGKTIYWNGSTDSTLADNGETGADWANAIIIDSAEELNYLVNNQQNYAGGSSFATKDKYYKMADGIDYAILQPEGTLNVEKLLSLDGAGVKLYFEDEIGLSNLVNWETNSGEMWFGGHFDGNGVTFAGMYSADNSAGLFATADGGAEFKNLAVVSSYIDGVAGNARTGAIVGGTCGYKYGAGVAGTVTFDTIMVANNYLHCYTNQGNGAIVMGACNDEEAVSINNAIVYGNASKYDNQGNTGLEDKTMHLYGAVKNSINASLKSTVTNSIILGTRPYYAWYDANMSGVESLENVYTDQPLNPYSQVTYATTDLAAITYDELIGSKAQSVVDALNNANDEDVWYIGNSFDGMPSFKKAGAIPTAFQSAYNSAVVLDTYNDYGESTEDFGLYTTSLNFKNNPYLSLTFAFGNLDGVNTKLDRQNITVTVNGTELPKLPAYEDDVYLSDVNGWTNKKGAGRYHMYKLDDLNVYDLSKPITVTIKYGDKTITSTVSVEGFALELQKAYMVAPCDYYATRLEAVKALLFYTQALNDRYGA